MGGNNGLRGLALINALFKYGGNNLKRHIPAYKLY